MAAKVAKTEGAVITAPNGAAAAPAEENKFLKAARARFAEDANSFWRQCDYYTAKKITGNDKMTWIQFCDSKKKAHADFWESKKTNPSLGARSQKPITDPEKLQKEKDKLKKMQEKMQKAQELIAASEAAAKTAVKK